MNVAKQTVLKHLTALAGEYVPLHQANVATMGGEGLEAAIWRDAGVTENRMWLIDRSPRRMHELMSQYPDANHLIGRLSRFPEILRTGYGDRSSLDYFHLDLCGTLEPALDDLKGLLSSLSSGTGKCLAVTVADARRNLSLDNRDVMLDAASKIFGRSWNRLRASLLKFHGLTCTCLVDISADPWLVTLREIGFMLNILCAMAGTTPAGAGEALRDGNRKGLPQLHLEPERIERFIYHSTPPVMSRMRTYFMHLKLNTAPVAIDIAGERLARLLIRAPCIWVDGENAMPMSEIRKGGKKITVKQANDFDESRQGAEKMNEDRLKQLRALLRPVMALSPDIRQNMEELFALAKEGVSAERRLLDDVIQTLERKRARLTANGSVVNAQPADEANRADSSRPSADTDKPVTVTEPESDKTDAEDRTPTAVVEAVQAGLSDLSKMDDIRLELLRAKAEGDEAFAAKKSEIAGRLGLGDGYSHKIAGIMTRMIGKRRPEYLARMLDKAEACDYADLLKELAGHFGISATKVKTEVKQAKRRA